MVLALLLAAAPKIAVLDARTGPGVDPALAGYLAQVLAKEVESRTGATPLVSADITAMLGFERNKRMLGCEEDAQCIAEITGALGVAQVLASSVAISSGRYLVSMSLIDPRHARPLKRTAESAPIDHDALVNVVRRSAWEMFGGPEPAPLAVAQPAPQASTGPTRRTWALVAGGAAVALTTAGIIVGANALSQAHEGSPTALSRAHAADILYLSALVAGGVGAYFWFSAAPAPGGAVATVAVAW